MSFPIIVNYTYHKIVPSTYSRASINLNAFQTYNDSYVQLRILLIVLLHYIFIQSYTLHDDGIQTAHFPQKADKCICRCHTRRAVNSAKMKIILCV